MEADGALDEASLCISLCSAGGSNFSSGDLGGFRFAEASCVVGFGLEGGFDKPPLSKEAFGGLLHKESRSVRSA